MDPEAYPDGLEIHAPIQTMSDDFSMAISGIPSMVNEFADGSFMETTITLSLIMRIIIMNRCTASIICYMEPW